jgi:hypothetical protein
MANNRELSQLASLIVVDDTTRNIGIATTGFSNVGIGTTNPLGTLQVGSGTSTFIVTGIGSVGIGITNPVTPLHISDGNGGISTALYTSDLVTISAQNSAPGFNIIAAGSAATQRGVFKTTRSRGTLSSPTVPLQGDDVFSLLGTIYDGSIGRATAAITMEVDGDVGLGTAPQRISFWTGSGPSRVERARLDRNGVIIVGSATSTGTTNQTLQVHSGGAYFSGSVGIGTTRPTTNLMVRVDQDDETAIRVNNNTDGVNAYSAVIAGNALGGLIFQMNASSRTNTRFGTSIGGFAEIYTSGTFTGSGIKFGTVTAHPIIIGTNNTEAMRIDSSQSVGIGTTNPTSKLHVIGDVLVTGITTSTDFNSSSDINLKDNIERIQNPIDKLQQLDGVTFNWKETHRASVGVIAQQVEKVLPQLVSGDETKTVNYNGLIALLIECVKEQQIEINNLKEKLK